MRVMTGFLLRLVGYAVALGIVARVAEFLWIRAALEGSLSLAPLHDAGITTLAIAPVFLALFGLRPLRDIAVFAAAFLAGAALTAPFALARLVAP